MEKLITIILTMFCILGLAGCSTKEIQSPGTPADEAFDIAVANTSVDIRRTTIKDFLINGIK